MRRIAALLFSLLLLIALCGCGGVSEFLDLAGELEDAFGEESLLGEADFSKENSAGSPSQGNALEEGSQEESRLENPSQSSSSGAASSQGLSVAEEGQYSAPEEVALYLHLYGHLPSNYLTKDEARELGWDSREGNLWEVAPGMSIGGDRFGNREGLLPEAQGRRWYECDVNYQGGRRGAERLCYSNDGLIYYSEDHYESFTLLYGGNEE